MMDPHQQRHYFACMQFADGVALMARQDFGEAYRRLSDAYDLLMELSRDPLNPDVLHTELFRTAVILAAGDYDQVTPDANVEAAQGMVSAWYGCRAAALGTQHYHEFGGLTSQALAHYQEAVGYFEAAIPLIEAGLDADHPDLLGPLGGYCGNLRAVGREAEADRVYERMLALPPSRLSPAMIGGGFPILTLDPFGTGALPSEVK
jgi:tetratricopeptide (TPR) repeat protein